MLLLLAACLSASALRLSPVSRLPAAPAASASRCSRVGAIRMEDGDEPDPKAVVSEATEKFKKSVASVQESLSTIRVGKASPNLLDRVTVNYYDTPCLL